MPKELSDLLIMPCAAFVILVAAIVSLAFVFTMQYGFHYEPCILCMWQRVPYAAALSLAMIALGKRPYGRQTVVLLVLCALAFAMGAGLATFHTGVERHWWLGTEGCSIHPYDAQSVHDLREQLLHTVVARCDEISWTFLGLSMANYNVPWSLLLAAFSACAARQSAKTAFSRR